MSLIKNYLYFLGLFLVSNLVNLQADEKYNIFEVLRFNEVSSFSSATPITSKVRDVWMGEQAYGLRISKDLKLPLSKDLKEIFEGRYISRSLSYSQLAPWNGAKTGYVVFYNEKHTAIYSAKFPMEKKGSVIFRQVINTGSLEKNTVRFSLGNETLVYFEIDSKELLEVLQNTFISNKHNPTTPDQQAKSKEVSNCLLNKKGKAKGSVLNGTDLSI